MQTAWDFILHVLDTLPPWLGAVLVGWAISVGMTQAVKFLIPVSVFHGHREQITRLIAMLSAAIPSGLVFDGSAGLAVLVAIGSGLWSPLAFALLQLGFRRWWPAAADVLSQDVRGVLAGNKVDTRP